MTHHEAPQGAFEPLSPADLAGLAELIELFLSRLRTSATVDLPLLDEVEQVRQRVLRCASQEIAVFSQEDRRHLDAALLLFQSFLQACVPPSLACILAQAGIEQIRCQVEAMSASHFN